MLNSLFARMAAARTPPPSTASSRQFFLERGPDPEPVPGLYEPGKDSRSSTPGAAARANWPTVAPVSIRDVWGGPEPSREELRRDHALLENANGVLVARVRALEAQLRAYDIEPVPAPASACL